MTAYIGWTTLSAERVHELLAPFLHDKDALGSEARDLLVSNIPAREQLRSFHDPSDGVWRLLRVTVDCDGEFDVDSPPVGV